jgi:hypothetical protein
MSSYERTNKHIFPKWVNYLLPFLVVGAMGAGVYVPGVMFFGMSPKTTDVGYGPVQPVPFSHQLHAGQLGMDCRYCHTTVEKAGFAAVPATQTCMGCHTQVWNQSPKLAAVRESWATGKPVEWVKIHDLPDYAYFNHSAHVTAGIGCATCHGRIDTMEVVAQAQPLSMAWCLDCHRAPEKHLRPKSEITNMAYSLPEDKQLELGLKLKAEYQIKSEQYMIACSTCHR